MLPRALWLAINVGQMLFLGYPLVRKNKLAPKIKKNVLALIILFQKEFAQVWCYLIKTVILQLIQH